jgi:tetratricopeptide (TPR) repeat protein
MVRFLDEVHRSAVRWLVCPLAYAWGRVWLRLRRPHRARRAFARVLEEAPDHFGSAMGLGRALLLMQDFEEAALAFRRARRIDPIRFEATREAVFLLQETEDDADRDDPSLGDPLDAEPGVYLRLPTFAFPTQPSCTEGFTRQHPRSNTKAFRFKDFASYEEYRKFQDASPISPEEIAATDWDRLIEQLGRK